MSLRRRLKFRFASLLLPFGLMGCGSPTNVDESKPIEVEATAPPPKPEIELGEPPRLPPEDGEAR